MNLKNINFIRKKVGLNLQELSEKSGVPLGTLSKITAGITEDPKLATLQAIAGALDCTINDLINNDDNEALPHKETLTIENEDIELDKQIIEVFESLSQDNRAIAIKYARFLKQEENKNRISED
jgi:transcriptional regulator with XRE-family HTH domain